MRLLFAHDHVFYKYNDHYYSTGGLSKEMLERYSGVFEEVEVVSRQKEIDLIDKKLTLASTERVSFIHVPDFKSITNYFKIKEAKTIVTKAVKNCDLVIARLPSSIGDLAVSAAIKYCKPYLIEVVACPWDAYWNHSFKGKLLAPFKYFSLKLKVSKSPYTIYVTNDFLQRRYPSKGNSTNCSNVALTEFDAEVLARRIQRIESMHSNSKIIIGTTAAVNVKYKGQQYIIEALGEMKKKGITSFEYHLVGGGEREFLTEIAKKNNVVEQVKFIGVIPHNKVFEWLETIDIYVQPSRQEGLPRALIEAMSRGVPSFGAKTAGIPELLEADFVFSNTKNNIKEICMILDRFNITSMKEQAIRNYNEALKYDKKIIEKRRRDFLVKFRKETDI